MGLFFLTRLHYITHNQFHLTTLTPKFSDPKPTPALITSPLSLTIKITPIIASATIPVLFRVSLIFDLGSPSDRAILLTKRNFSEIGRRRGESNPCIAVLQTAALPLRHCAIIFLSSSLQNEPPHRHPQPAHPPQPPNQYQKFHQSRPEQPHPYKPGV